LLHWKLEEVHVGNLNIAGFTPRQYLRLIKCWSYFPCAPNQKCSGKSTWPKLGSGSCRPGNFNIYTLSGLICL